MPGFIMPHIIRGMNVRIKKIISLQEYAKKRRKQRVGFLDCEEDCRSCEFYRKESEVCLGGNNIIKLKHISYCPITNKKIEVNRE